MAVLISVIFSTPIAFDHLAQLLMLMIWVTDECHGDGIGRCCASRIPQDDADAAIGSRRLSQLRVTHSI